MRHTFISMFVAKFRSKGEAALQAGNSEGIIRRHYLNLKSLEEAEQFFGILPSHVPAVSEKKCDRALSLVHFAAQMRIVLGAFQRRTGPPPARRFVGRVKKRHGVSFYDAAACK